MTEKDPADKSFDEKRHDQLTTAPKADEGDAAPRVTTTETDEGVTRIDIADTAAVRPGKPDNRTEK
jgi:hypothetical protein